MSAYITTAQINIQAGCLSGEVKFLPGLNFISGENGTLKTKLLRFLRSSAPLNWSKGQSGRIQAISPRRNAVRRASAQILDQLRRENIKLDSINERALNDASFESYPALGDLFFVVYDDLCKDGGSQIEKMRDTEAAFNEVITRIFSQYRLVSRWNYNTGSPEIEILKNGIISVPLEGLSLGEQEALSLALNIYCSRHRYDVFLIDEPEVHLNWNLEERLFDFFNTLQKNLRSS